MDAHPAVEREGGRFRSFLIGVTKNVLGNALKRERAQKRGGGEAKLSLDQDPDRPLEAVLPDPQGGDGD